MNDNRKKIIKEIYIYRESHLPTDGWIQKCFHCDTLTSKNILNTLLPVHCPVFFSKIFFFQ